MLLMAHMLTLLLLAAPTAEKCVTLQSAYEKLLSSSFTVERRMTVNMNGKLKAREVARLDYADRQLVTEQLELDLRDKNLVIEPTQSDAALEARLTCDLVEDLGNDRYRVRTKDGMEELEFILDTGRNALIPTLWRSREKTRFLWKKLIIETEVIYGSFEWRD
jgi:hypothetical protein